MSCSSGLLCLCPFLVISRPPCSLTPRHPAQVLLTFSASPESASWLGVGVQREMRGARNTSKRKDKGRTLWTRKGTKCQWNRRWGGAIKIFKSLKDYHLEGMTRDSHCSKDKKRQREHGKNQNRSQGADLALRALGNATLLDTDHRSWPRSPASLNTHYGLSSTNISVLSLSLFLYLAYATSGGYTYYLPCK